MKSKSNENPAGREKVYVLGAGAIGLTLAACLAREGREVVAVRTSQPDVPPGRIIVALRLGEGEVQRIPVETISLAKLTHLQGIVVVTAKSHTNKALAAALAARDTAGSLVIMQNGVGIEQPFLTLPCGAIFRCVLYVTGQVVAENEVIFRSIASSPIGLVQGDTTRLDECVATLTTSRFPFHAEPNIQRDIWKKTIMNSVFNSICPLLEIDNGIFARRPDVVELARELVRECLVLAGCRGISLSEFELMEQIMKISRGSEGVLISTLQDLKNGRETEIDSLNLEMARLASSMHPAIDLGKTEFLGKMVLAKSTLSTSRK